MKILYNRSRQLLVPLRKPTSWFTLTLALLLSLFFYPLVGFSTDYYFSTSIGDDNRTITQAQNPDTPWKTIDKLNAIANALVAGDRVLFASGEIFYGTIHIVKGGNDGNPVVYTSYGTGAPAIITSLEELAGWRSIGGGLYEASVPSLQSSVVQILEINNSLREIGRHPNTDSENPFLDIVSINNPNSLNGQPDGNDYTGGEIVIRKNNWIIDRHPITSMAGSTINYGTINTGYPAKHGYGYFIQNHVKTLDIYGEWAYDSKLKTITAYVGPNPTGTEMIKVATRDYLVTNQAYIRNITFSNLHLKGANKNLFQIKNSGNFKIEKCILESAGEDGVYVESVPDLNIIDNTIRNNLNRGVFVYYGSPRVTIKNNLVENTMPFNGMAQSSDMKGIGLAIGSDSDYSLVEGNQVVNTGYNGIHFGGNYTIIKNNLVENFCVYKQDGGGIYTNSDGYTNQKIINITGREIVNNIVIHGIGNIDGNEEKVFLAHGIYLDDVAKGLKVYGNTVSEITGVGVFLHNNNTVEVTDNLIYKVKTQILATHDPLGTPIRDIIIEGNQVSSVFDGEIAMDFNSVAFDLDQFGTVNNNYFLDPYNKNFIFNSKDPDDGPTPITRNLNSWRQELTYDFNSRKPRFNLEQFEILTSDTIKFTNFNSASDTEIIAGLYNGDLAWEAEGIEAGSITITPHDGKNASAYIQIGAVKAGEEILLQFDSRSPEPNKEIQAFLEQTFNANQEGTIRYFSTRQTATSIQLVFKAEVTASSESVVISIPDPANPVFFDNMTIARVTTKELNILEYIYFNYNFSADPVVEPLPGIYRNAKNEIFTERVTIPPYSSVLLVQGAVPDNLPPSPIEISITTPTPHQEFYGGDSVDINTEITDPNGGLTKVFFYQGDTVIARIYEPPFIFTWPSPIPGSYNLKAQAFDRLGRSSESEIVPIIVLEGGPDNIPPTVVIQYPADNQNIDLGNDVVISTLPNDEDGTVDRVEIFVDGDLIGTVSQAPYEVTWTPASIASYSITATVYDTEGEVGNSEAITVNITEPPAANLPPSIQITAPTEAQNLLFGQPLSIITDAEDPENNIDRVEFYTGDELIGNTDTAPFNFTWIDAASGAHSLTATVYDQEGLFAISDAVNINVIDTSIVDFPPVIVIEEPVREAVIGTGALLRILAAIYDPENDLDRVEFYSGNELIGTVSTDPAEIIWTADFEVGTYLLYAIAYDNSGASGRSQNVIVHVVPDTGVNLPPVISISEPTQNQDQNYAEDLLIQTNPYDPENEIRSVSIFADGELLTRILAPPYEYTWSQIPLGAHQIYAVVTDREGQVGTSETINISISNFAPTISIAEPIDGQTFLPGQNVLIQTDPIDPENEIAKVEFFYNDQILAIVTEAPYEYNWVNPPVGTHTLKTKVFDAYGLTAESARPMITVSEDLPPTITIIEPIEAQEYNYAEQMVIKTAPVDPENQIAQVQIFADGGLLTTLTEAPYDYEWINAPRGYPHKIYAVVTDQGGQSAVSEEVEFTVRNFAPTVSLTEPTDGQFVTLGDDLLIVANAIDPEDEIQKVEFFVNDALIATVAQAPFEFNWISPAEGSYSIKAIVYDVFDLTGESQLSNIVVRENLAPTISLVQPEDGQTFSPGGDVLIQTTPVDPEGAIQKVEFFANDVLIATVTEAPYDFNWTSPTEGSHLLKAMIYDDFGLTGESQIVSIRVGQNLPPTITITEPAEAQEYNYSQPVMIKTNPVDPENEIDYVQIFADGAFLAQITAAPYDYEWSDVPMGYPHKVYAIVVDKGGEVGYSEEVEFTVMNFAPIITLAEPTGDQFINLGEDVLIAANASDPEGQIQKVEFLADDVLIATVTEAPYEFNWISPAEGRYSIKAVVYDVLDLTGESQPANIAVRENLAPTISLVQPEDGQTFSPGADVLIQTAPVDPEGEIQNVEFFADDVLIATVTSAPYQFTWSNPEEGSYLLKAVVYDSFGLTGESDETSILIGQNLPPTISITQPTNGQVFISNQPVLIKTNPVDPENGIDYVEIFADGALLARINQIPYDYEWSNVPTGYPHKMYATVTDKAGHKGYSEEIEFTVLNSAPSVSIVQPANGQVFNLGDEVLIRTNTTASESNFEKVQFYADGVLVATLTEAASEFNLEGLPSGTYMLKAKIYGKDGTSAESSVTKIRIVEYPGFDDGAKPSVRATPNPATSFINLHLTNFDQVDNLRIDVVDMKGNHVDTIQLDRGTESIKLDISKYTPGTYLFKILGDNNVLIIKKVIKL